MNVKKEQKDSDVQMSAKGKTNEIEVIYAAIGIRVRFIREALGMKQEELAAAIGQTRTSVVNIEQGRQRILLHTLQELATALHTTPKHLLRGTWV